MSVEADATGTTGAVLGAGVAEPGLAALTQQSAPDDALSDANMPMLLRGFAAPDEPRDDFAQRCIRCGFCLPTCPTYVETYREASSPRGRIHLIQAVAAGKLDVADPTFVDQMYECLDCRACEAVCPSGVPYGQLVETARTQIERAQPGPRWRRALRAAIFDGLFADQRVFRGMGALARVYQRSGAQWLARRSGALGWLGLRETEALLPDMPGSFVAPAGEVYAPLAGVPRRGRVALLTGCVMSVAFAETDRATIRVLNANGYEVVTPAGQQCCGALTIHAGEMDRARMLAAQNIMAFEAADADFIISNAAGCGSALKEYGQLFDDDLAWRDRAATFADRVRDVTELLGALLAHGQLNTRFEPLPMRVTYQDACHLAHAQRISAQPRALLQAIPGLRLVEMEEPSLCCGSAGVYNLTRPQMANQLGARKASHAMATGAEAVVTANPGCWLQLRATLAQAESPMRVVHLVDLLDAAYRGRPLADHPNPTNTTHRPA